MATLDGHKDVWLKAAADRGRYLWQYLCSLVPGSLSHLPRPALAVFPTHPRPGENSYGPGEAELGLLRFKRPRGRVDGTERGMHTASDDGECDVQRHYAARGNVGVVAHGGRGEFRIFHDARPPAT